jgi:flagellar hook-basal body complex protein FliE
MMIESIQPIAAAHAESVVPAAKEPSVELTDFVSHLNETPGTAIESVENMIVGEPTEIHSLMIELEVAKLQMQLAVEIRNKLVEAYQELSRMQV